MLVKNNLPTVLDFPGTTLRAPGTENDGVVIPSIHLLPGTNDVDPEAWAMWTTGRARSKGKDGKPAGLNWHLDVRNVEIVKVEVEPADKDGHSVVKTVTDADFAELKAADAIELAKETFDLARLNAWVKAEEKGKDRTTVLDALADQIDVLEAEVTGTEDDE
jgi:hypothetical protein